MPTKGEVKALSAIFDAANALSNDYAKSGGACDRRDQMKVFITSVIEAMENLAQAYDEDGMSIPSDCIRPDAQAVCQSIDEAFMYAVQAEEELEPDFSRPYSTLYVQNGSVVG